MLTEAQKNAIEARNSNILVSAAAGSGKTHVLVERVIQLITQDDPQINIDRLLIVTFTNAAAAEMRSRISKKLSEKLIENRNDTNIVNQLSLLPGAKICTIDSFCINLVRENFFNLNIAQDFTILDETQRMLIEQNAVDSVFEELYDSDDEEFKKLVDSFSNEKNDRDLAQTVISINEYITAQPYPFEWLKQAVQAYNPENLFGESECKQILTEQIKDSLDFAMSLVDASMQSLSSDDELYEKYYQMLESDKNIFYTLKKAINSDWDEFREKVKNTAFAKMPSKRGYESPSKAIIASNRDVYKKSIMQKDITELCSLSAADYYSDCTQLYPVLIKLESVVEMYNNKLRAIKDEMNAYSFSDIEHLAIELLFTCKNGEFVRTKFAEEYKDRYDEILVDEYQDTNLAQDKLFEMLSNDKNRFMVGDVKQSIYGFRLAMPFIFNEKKNCFNLYGTAKNSVNQKIILDRNFRSRLGVCEFANFIFSRLMSERVGEMEYTEEEYLNSENAYHPSEIPSAQLYLVETPKDEKKDEYEAKQLALFIKNKVEAEEQIKDGDVYRNIKYGDFAVLFRAPKNRLPVFSKVLSQYGIPVSSNNKTNLFENNEISVLLSLLRVIDNPLLDIPLLATLMSVFYGYSAQDIARAKIKYRGTNLYSSISASRDKFSKFFDDMDKYRSYAASMSTQNFLRKIISETSYLSVISAMGNAEQRRLNVKMLIDIAKKFDSGYNVGLTAFIRYIDNIIQYGGSIESAPLVNADDNSVSLMSVHQSKGLEFPVCILADTDHLYNQSDLHSAIQLSSRWGIGVKVFNENAFCRYNSMQYTAVKCMNRIAAMSENLRVLYVAVTRAKEQFIAFVSCKNVGDYLEKQASRITDGKIYPYTVQNIRCDGDLLTMCSLLHADSRNIKKEYSISVKPDLSYDFPMRISVLNYDEKKSQEKVDLIPSDENTVKQLENKLAFSYSRKELSGFASKRTASSLDEADQGFEFFAKRKPAFLDNKNMTSAQKGTAMHTFMQYCDYQHAKNNLDAEIQRLMDLSFLTAEQADSLSREKLSDLFCSDFAKRMYESDKLYREIKVSSFVPVCEIENTDFTDSVLVQGIADCVFEENGELVLVDYKTDKVKCEQELLDRYKRQIGFYRKAVEKSLGKPVKQALLYSFHLGKECIYK